MDFALSLDQKGLGKDIQEFSRRFLALIAAECDETRIILTEIWNQMVVWAIAVTYPTWRRPGLSPGCPIAWKQLESGAAAGHLLSWAVSTVLGSIPIISSVPRNKRTLSSRIANGELCVFALLNRTPVRCRCIRTRAERSEITTFSMEPKPL